MKFFLPKSDEIKSHQDKFDKNNIRDYIDGYLKEMQERKIKDPNTSITRNIHLIPFGLLITNTSNYYSKQWTNLNPIVALLLVPAVKP